jgi:hypothetical protein
MGYLYHHWHDRLGVSSRPSCNDLILTSQDRVDPRIASLASRAIESNRERKRNVDEQDDDDAVFAELEAEIENDSSAEMRETGLQAFKRE